MKRLTACVLTLLAVCLLTLPQTAFAEEGGETVVGYGTDIISSLSLPDYKKSTVCESELGRLAADAMRSQTGSDLAILGGGELSGGLGKGDLTETEVRNVLPENRQVAVVRVTPAQLWDIMEYGVSFSVLGEDEKIDAQRSEFAGFPQISGFEVEYDASQVPGKRVREIRVDGQALTAADEETTYTLAVSQFLLDRERGYPVLADLDAQESELGTADLLLAYVKELGQVDAPANEHIHAVGTADNTILNNLGILPFLPLVIILILLVSIPINRKRLRNLDGSRSKRYRDYGDGNYDL